MSKMHLKKPGFSHSFYGPLTKNKESKKIKKKTKKTGDSRHIY